MLFSKATHFNKLSHRNSISYVNGTCLNEKMVLIVNRCSVFGLKMGFKYRLYALYKCKTTIKYMKPVLCKQKTGFAAIQTLFYNCVLCF